MDDSDKMLDAEALEDVSEELEDESEEEEDEGEEESEEPALTPEQLAALCAECKGRCCKYYTVLLDEPEDADDYDELRWFLAHKDCYIYIDEKQWHLNVDTDCRFLDVDGRCKIYEHRPDVCRDFGKDEECEFTGEYDFEATFRTIKELDAYIRTKLPPEELAKIRLFPEDYEEPN